MLESKGYKEVNNFINKKKRKKKFKKRLMILAIVLIAIILFFTKAPIFNIKEIEFQGTSSINSETLLEKVKDIIGTNIFTVDEGKINDVLKDDKYIKNVDVKRKGNSKLIITIDEEAPVFYVKNNETYEIINDSFVVLEEVNDISNKNYVEIIGVDVKESQIGDRLSDSSTNSNILKSFYPYIAQNKEAIKIDSIDISDFVNIKLKIQAVDIYFGDVSNIHEKMENIYRILLSEQIKLTKGYINVSFEGPPVIKRYTD